MPNKSNGAKAKYQREWIARRRAEWFKGKCCTDCGSTDRLELDHRDPSTKVTNSIWSWNAERIKEEAAKCDVRCGPCHRKRHRRRPDISELLRRNKGPAGTLWCGIHKSYLPANKFSKDRHRWTGYQDICKECRSKRRSLRGKLPESGIGPVC